MKRKKKRKKQHSAADIDTIAGRKRAYYELIWSDHGFLRVYFSNLHQISPEMWRSNQPSPKQIKAHAEDRQIKTILNLRGVSTQGYYLLEREAAQNADIDLIDYQVFSRDMPSREKILGTPDLFEKIRYPALIHCKSGADRAGLMSTLYRIARQNQPVSQAIEQLSFKYLHIKQGKTGILDYFFNAALQARADQPKDFFSWIAQEYEANTLKAAFLKETGRQIELDRLLGRE